MGASAQPALEVLEWIPVERAKGYVFVAEGAVAERVFGEVGGVSFGEGVKELAKSALAVIAVGSCASFGGIPAARPNPTKAMGIKAFLQKEGLGTP